MRDDCLNETEDVKEAIRRLPKDLYDERVFRIARALSLSNKKTILPKEEWTNYDMVNHWLQASNLADLFVRSSQS